MRYLLHEGMQSVSLRQETPDEIMSSLGEVYTLLSFLKREKIILLKKEMEIDGVMTHPRELAWEGVIISQHAHSPDFTFPQPEEPGVRGTSISGTTTGSSNAGDQGSTAGS